MKKILILGSAGMAGHMISRYLELTKKYEIRNISHRTVVKNSISIDVKDEQVLSEYILDYKPDIIVNCIGILIHGSKNTPDNAIYINAYFPHKLASITKQINAKLIHLSTDCVFSGKKGYYNEDSIPDANDIYGRSKALGEVCTINDLTIRTSIIGPEIKPKGEGLLHWFFNEQTIKGYSNVYWGGVTTLELAKAIEYAIDYNTVGLVHLTNGERISKYDLLLLVNKKAKLNIQIEKELGKSVDKSLQTIRDNFYIVNSYKKMICELVEWIIENKLLYTNIYPEFNMKGK